MLFAHECCSLYSFHGCSIVCRMVTFRTFGSTVTQFSFLAGQFSCSSFGTKIIMWCAFRSQTLVQLPQLALHLAPGMSCFNTRAHPALHALMPCGFTVIAAGRATAAPISALRTTAGPSCCSGRPPSAISAEVRCHARSRGLQCQRSPLPVVHLVVFRQPTLQSGLLQRCTCSLLRCILVWCPERASLVCSVRPTLR